MRLRVSLVLLNLLVIELIMAIILSPPNGLRIILRSLFVLLFRGYALVTALLIKKEGMGNIEGVTLAFGMSTVVVGLTELALNYTPWGIGALLCCLVYIYCLRYCLVALLNRNDISNVNKCL